MKNISHTKKGPGRQSNTSFKKKASKLVKQSKKHTVGLKNKVVSLVDSHFMEVRRNKFINK